MRVFNLKATLKFTAIVILVFFVKSTGFGQAIDEVPADSIYTNHLTLMPVIGSAPETGLMLGGVAMQQFKPAGSGQETRPSSIIVSAIYTLNKQMLFEFVPAVILRGESWLFGGSLFAYYFPDSFWGIGPDTQNDEKMSIEYKMFNVNLTALKQVHPSFYAGPVVHWYHKYDFGFSDSDGREFDPYGLTGTEDGGTIGAGGAVRWDKRNSIMTPERNHYIELNVIFYPEHSQYGFDARKYVDLMDNGKSILAFQTKLQVTRGDVPFLELADLGGNEILRGYYQGRFRDKNSMQFQTEWRQHIRGRFGFAVFGGIGQVWPSMDKFTLNNIKYSGGGGLRYNLNPGDTTNLRVDFAAGKNTSGFYLTFGEAF